MGTVMIRCPRTGDAVSTEIDTDLSVFERLPEVAGWMHCPLCAQEHTWSASEAWLSDTSLVPKIRLDS